MRRNVDLRCVACAHEQANVLVDDAAIPECPACHAAMEQIWWKRAKRHDAQWDDNTAVMVLVNSDPSCPEDVRIRYPGRHDARVPPGYERVYLRSLPEVSRFERAHKVVNHVMHYDSNGRAIDDTYRGQKMVH